MITYPFWYLTPSFIHTIILAYEYCFQDDKIDIYRQGGAQGVKILHIHWFYLHHLMVPLRQ